MCAGGDDYFSAVLLSDFPAFGLSSFFALDSVLLPDSLDEEPPLPDALEDFLA